MRRGRCYSCSGLLRLGRLSACSCLEACTTASAGAATQAAGYLGRARLFIPAPPLGKLALVSSAATRHAWVEGDGFCSTPPLERLPALKGAGTSVTAPPLGMLVPLSGTSAHFGCAARQADRVAKRDELISAPPLGTLPFS